MKREGQKPLLKFVSTKYAIEGHTNSSVANYIRLSLTLNHWVLAFISRSPYAFAAWLCLFARKAPVARPHR
jgi:hypothetical protein